MGAGKAVAQQHLGDAETVDHRDRHLIALLLAIGERGAGERQREIDVMDLKVTSSSSARSGAPSSGASISANSNFRMSWGTPGLR